MSQKIHVEVRLYASLEKVRPRLKAGEPVTMELEKESSVGQLVETLGIAPKSVQLIFVNAIVQGLDHVVRDGDHVALFPPIGGG